jgi:DNA polymerase-1
MITLSAWLRESRIDACLIMQVHDELVFEVRREAAEELTAQARKLMSAAADLKVPLKVDVGVGDNWDRAH